MTFSLCMIVKNEEKTISRCLNCVKDVFDEIIVVDTGSFDKTKPEAAKYTDKIYDYAWKEDFADARNFSFSKAAGDYIMWLDADDVMDEEEVEKLKELKSTLSENTDVVMLKYAVAFDKDGKETFSYFRERIVRRNGNFRWKGFVHEVITPHGNVFFADITVKHVPVNTESKDPSRNLRIYETHIARGEILDARQKYYYARELYYNGRNEKAAGVLEDFVRDKGAWAPDKANAYLLLYEIYAKENPEKAVEAVAKGLMGEYMCPQLFCAAGDIMLEKGLFSQAVLWYKTALMCPKDYRKYGFVIEDYEEYYPYMQLCLCYDRTGDHKTAREYNEKAKMIKPESDEVKYNERYFENIFSGNGVNAENAENK